MTLDPNVELVISKIRERSSNAIREYGVNTTREDYDLADWLEEAMWESIDKAIYLAAAISALRKSNDSVV
jgi:hypothetical protein